MQRARQRLGLAMRILQLWATIRNLPPETENHGVPGSSPGPATPVFQLFAGRSAYPMRLLSLPFLGTRRRARTASTGWPSAAQQPKARETLESREDRWQDFARPCTIFTATPAGRDWFRTLETRSAKTGDLSRSGHDTDRAYVRARPGGRSRRRELGWGRKNIPGWAGGPQGGSFRPPGSGG